MKAVSPKAARAGCSFRNEDLTIARQELDQIAFTMANRMNEQHAEGYTPDGDKGGDLFSPADIKAYANAKNTGTGKLGAINVTNYTDVKSENYTVTSDGAGDGRSRVKMDAPYRPPSLAIT